MARSVVARSRPRRGRRKRRPGVHIGSVENRGGQFLYWRVSRRAVLTIRRICVFTGSRADYGSLVPVMTALRDDTDVDLKLLVSGGHLVPTQGYTLEQVTNDGFVADEVVDMVLANDTPTAVAKSFGLGCIGFADALDRLNPDLLVVLGDRYEALAVATCAMVRLLPVAHLAGGDVTEGSTDDAVRHAITKMSHLHFTATEEMRRRVVQLGEQPDRVFNTGAPTIDSILTAPFVRREDWEATYGRELTQPTIVVTYHPVTTDPDASHEGLVALLDALEHFPHAAVVFTGTNV
ncbi:MAG: UDP-N-acetylglucosamine 2-epimerase (hydrolyzing), partial [Actinophytocola sp.]|nr:UDP-N-acetylglucosamine 2-epimerase (hydrolyzing) [Actinophytocola sp.]